MKFVPKDEEPEAFYTVAGGGNLDGYNLTYSKDTDNFAIGKTSLGDRPCANSKKDPNSPESIYYPLERDRNDGCTKDSNSGKYYDERYTSIGLSISEYQVQLESGVISKLEE